MKQFFFALLIKPKYGDDYLLNDWRAKKQIQLKMEWIPGEQHIVDNIVCL